MYSTEEVSIISGASKRQLQWWDEEGYLKPEKRPRRHGGGTVRAYTEGQAREAMRIAEKRRLHRFPMTGEVFKLLSEHDGPVIVTGKPVKVGTTLVIPIQERKKIPAKVQLVPSYSSSKRARGAK